MKIFLSHKKEDYTTALMISKYLSAKGISNYLDLLDDQLIADPGRLTSHLRDQIRESTHLMAILSQQTQMSWWVPFEIGIATDCGNPIATYLAEWVTPPEYLRVWPFLRSTLDLDRYISELTVQIALNDSIYKKAWSRQAQADEFHRRLKKALGQR